MADTIIKKWNGSTFDEVYPRTTHTQIVATGTPSSSTFLRGDGTWAVPSGVDNYVNITGDTMTGTLTISNISPTIKLNDTDTSADDFFLHANNSRFYVLTDRNDDGSHETPYPLELNNALSTGLLYGNEILTSSSTLPSHTHSASDIVSGTLDAARLPTILGTLEQVYSGTTTVTCTTASTVVTLTLDSGKSITATETLLLEVDASNASTVSSYEKAYVMVRMGSNQSTTDTPFMSWSSLDSATTGNVRQWSALCRFSSTTSIQFRYGGYHLQTNTSSKTFGTFYVHRIWKVTN